MLSVQIFNVCYNSVLFDWFEKKLKIFLNSLDKNIKYRIIAIRLTSEQKW